MRGLFAMRQAFQSIPMICTFPPLKISMRMYILVSFIWRAKTQLSKSIKMSTTLSTLRIANILSFDPTFLNTLIENDQGTLCPLEFIITDIELNIRRPHETAHHLQNSWSVYLYYKYIYKSISIHLNNQSTSFFLKSLFLVSFWRSFIFDLRSYKKSFLCYLVSALFFFYFTSGRFS